VQIERLEDGNRRVTSITEVQRMESDVITLQELFTYKVERVTDEHVTVGTLVSTGLRPTFLNKFAKRGVSLPAGLFHETRLPPADSVPSQTCAARAGSGSSRSRRPRSPGPPREQRRRGFAWPRRGG